MSNYKCNSTSNSFEIIALIIIIFGGITFLGSCMMSFLLNDDNEPNNTVNSYEYNNVNDNINTHVKNNTYENNTYNTTKQQYNESSSISSYNNENNTEKVETDTKSSSYVYSSPVKERSTEYILNTNTKKFHLSGCSSLSKMKETNKKYSTESREELIAKGYDPCKRCNP